jgi:hypothetical protein
MPDDLVRRARRYVGKRTEEPHVRPCRTNMGHPEQKPIHDRGETAATRLSHRKHNHSRRTQALL